MTDRIKCWHCARVVDPQSICFIPEQAFKSDGKWSFSGRGIFHDAMCLHAWLNNYWESGREHRMPNLRTNFRLYCEHGLGLSIVPPPALPKECLVEFGGALDWNQWRSRALKNLNITHWGVHVDLSMPGSINARNLCELKPITRKKATCAPSNLPGETNVLDAFISK